MKRCSRCNVPKSEEAFTVRRIVPSGRYGVCKECEKEKRKNWNIKNHRKGPAAVKRYHNKHRARFLIRYAQERAQEKKWAFDLDAHRKEIQARIDSGFCELSGVRLDLNGSRSFNSPSIDRIDSSRGYTYDNIRIICFAMNSALGNWGEEVLFAVFTSWLGKRQREEDAGGNGRITQAAD